MARDYKVSSDGAPWIEIYKGRTLARRTINTVRKWVRAGSVRQLSSADIVWVSRDDLVWCARRAWDGKCKVDSPPSLVERNFAPIECLGMSGDELYRWALENAYTRLLLPDPPEHDLDNGVLDEIRIMRSKIHAIESLLHQVIGRSGLPSKLPSFDLRTTDELMRKVHAALNKTGWTLKDMDGYLRVLGGMSHPHYTAIERWAIAHPNDAQEMCGKGLPPHAPILRLAWRLRTSAEAYLQKSPSPLSEETAEKAKKIYDYVEERCRERVVLWSIREQTEAPVGTTETDQWILSRLL